ncbi:MAG TPA: beta-ketoacyl-ACP synthase II [Blastocatellia bacterium]|nr:beta-ketoacyl-ACP synthase II [Blastocatellia bacterium]
MKRRVVITGLGAVTPIGIGVDKYWEGLVNGTCGISTISRYDVSSFATKIAAEVKNFNLGDYSETNAETSQLDRRIQYTMAAAEMAIENSGLALKGDHWIDTGVYLGAGEGTANLDEFADMACRSGNGDPTVDLPKFVLNTLDIYDGAAAFLKESNMPAAFIAMRYGAMGPVSNCLTACAASSQAIGEAYRVIQRGDADVMITGGAHAMTGPLDLIGFSQLSALSQNNQDPSTACRPFDAKRDGFVLGEGAGIIVAEELSHAIRRKARIYAEIIGYGQSNDAYRVTDMHPEARGAIRAITAALDEARVAPESINYINAHGTSTVENDKNETMAIKAAFGDYAYRLNISSTKSMTGHLIAAAGAAELIATTLALQSDVIPPTINYCNPDPNCDLDYVPNEARERRIRAAISNSFGFGGQNVSLVVARPEF